MTPLAELAQQHGLTTYYISEAYCGRCGFLRLATLEPLPKFCPCPRCNLQNVLIMDLRGKVATRKQLPLVDRVAAAVNQDALRALERALEPPSRPRPRPACASEYRDPATGTLRSLRPTYYETHSGEIHERRRAKREAARQQNGVEVALASHLAR